MHRGYGYNFVDSPSGLIVPVTADVVVDGLDAKAVAFDIVLPGGTTNFLREDGTWAIPSGGGGAPTLYDYVERTTNLVVTATSAATAQAFISGNAVSYDGSTRIRIEAFVASSDITGNQFLQLELYDGSTDLGILTSYGSASNSGMQIYGCRFLTPSNASHTYNIKTWKTGGTANLYAAGTYLPAFLSITEA